MIRTIIGTRATVDIADVPGGYAWDCRNCKRFAGRPLKRQEADPGIPFRATMLPSGETVTAEDFVTRAATRHAEEVCAP